MTHELKCWPIFFENIQLRLKKFELRKDDRDFKQGDTLKLCEWCPVDREYTGRVTHRLVIYTMRDVDGAAFGLQPGFICMAISDEESMPNE